MCFLPRDNYVHNENICIVINNEPNSHLTVMLIYGARIYEILIVGTVKQLFCNLRSCQVKNNIHIS